jgi:hypothetical protein
MIAAYQVVRDRRAPPDLSVKNDCCLSGDLYRYTVAAGPTINHVHSSIDAIFPRLVVLQFCYPWAAPKSSRILSGN